MKSKLVFVMLCLLSYALALLAGLLLGFILERLLP